MRQWLDWTTTGADVRSLRMGENVIRLVDRRPGLKAIVWAHNVHVGVGAGADSGPNLGALLREQYGRAYVAIGLECGEGSYLTRLRAPDDRLGDLHVATLPTAEVGSLAWYLSAADIGDAVLISVTLRRGGGRRMAEATSAGPRRVLAPQTIDIERVERRGAIRCHRLRTQEHADTPHAERPEDGSRRHGPLTALQRMAARPAGSSSAIRMVAGRRGSPSVELCGNDAEWLEAREHSVPRRDLVLTGERARS